tara:strand:- start:142589 stop:143122 length:534 start_codon:yes stop_codon:yes gene_type:complete
MKSIIYLLLILPIFTIKEDPIIIPWEENTKLSWKDFTGKPDSGNSFVASTHSSIVFSYKVTSENGKLTLTTQTDAFFYPEMSWFIKGEVNDHILKHEQGHFDITELHARKLRKAFAEYKVTKNYKRELTAIFTTLNNDRQKMQNLYDKETNHSRNVEKEINWQKFIAAELLRYAPWK